MSRRSAILVILSFATGAAGSAVYYSSSVRARRASRDGSAPIALPAFVEEMLRIDAAELVLRSGEFERTSRMHRGNGGVVAGFERLMLEATRSHNADADTAAQCAVRTFAKFDRFDLVRKWERLLRSMPRYQGAARTARRLREREER